MFQRLNLSQVTSGLKAQREIPKNKQIKPPKKIKKLVSNATKAASKSFHTFNLTPPKIS